MKKIGWFNARVPRKLGDAMFMHSLFIHYGSVEWPIEDFLTNPTWDQVAEIYEGRYQLRTGCMPTMVNNLRNIIFEAAMDGMKIAPVDIVKDREYITYQKNAKDPTRALQGDLKGIDVGGCANVRELMELQAGATLHIGADSGTLWTALAVRTPVQVILNRRPDSTKTKEQDRTLLTLLRNHDNVEVRW